MTGPSELKLYRADLHIHSCLSPCGDWDMSPAAIVKNCREKKIDIIALTDHNTAENTEVTVELGKKAGLIVFPGMEICTAEEVHVIAVFETVNDAMRMQREVYSQLSGENNPEVFGYQIVADEEDQVVRQNEKLLIGATAMGLNRVVEKIHSFNGIAIAAHIDKKAFSILGQLGFIPPDLDLDAVEVSFRERPESAADKLLHGMKVSCITASDAHYVEEIGRVTTRFRIDGPTLGEIKKALAGEDGREILYSGVRKRPDSK